jgi:hypothetical protein
MLGAGAILNNMYEEDRPMTAKQPEHLSVATDMANDIANREPNMQNEMLKHITALVRENRQQMIDETEKKLAYLKDTFQQI